MSCLFPRKDNSLLCNSQTGMHPANLLALIQASYCETLHMQIEKNHVVWNKVIKLFKRFLELYLKSGHFVHAVFLCPSDK